MTALRHRTLMGAMEVDKDGRAWQIGTPDDVEWIAGRPLGVTIATAVPLVFEAYGTFHQTDETATEPHERAVVDELARHGGAQDWWLGYLDTGAHDIVFPDAPRVLLYWQWPYVLVKAGPEQALTWRTGRRRGRDAALPELVFPTDRSWLLSALWDDAWTCVGGPDELVEALVSNPLANARRVGPDDDTLPPGLVRD